MKDRTYGIEIECFANIDAAELGRRIERKFTDRGIAHTVSSHFQYRQSVDGLNVSRWEVKRDGSLRVGSLGSRFRGVEVVSPVLKGRDGLTALAAVCEVLNESGCKVNKTAGLHIHHGVQRDEIRSISKVWFAAERLVMGAMPMSRRVNSFCKMWTNHIRSSAEIYHIERVKYMTLNLKSFFLRNTVEFRAHSGTVEYKKIAGWLLFTQGLIESAVERAEGRFESIDEIAEYIAPAAVAGNPYRAGTLKAELVEFLTTPKAWNEVKAHFGRQMSKEKKALERDGLLIENGGFFKVVGAADADYIQGAEYIKARYERFSGVRRAA